MSINTTPTTTVTKDTTDFKSVTDLAVDSSINSKCVDVAPSQEVTAIKKEYSIVGDAFYAGINSDTAPFWLTDLIDSVVQDSVNNGLTDYASLVQDVRNAIDSIDVAKNTYVEQINFNSLVDGIIGTHLDTLNTNYDNKFATIVNLDVVKADADSALTMSISDLRAEVSEDISSRITTVENAFAAGDQVNANSITSLTSAFADQEIALSGTADAVSGLQTYVGLSDNGEPYGGGLLGRVGLVEKQNDGTIEYVTNTYDVMIGIEDPNNNTDNDELIVDALPYVLWTNMSGSGAPTTTTRAYTDYSLQTPATAQAPILDNTIYVRSDYTDDDTDRYYKFLSGSWSAITKTEYTEFREMLKAAHVADVYIQYVANGTGGKSYVKSYKFIKTAVDGSSPYSTDSEGYTWAIVTDTDAQSAYVNALQAKEMADGKVSSFYAWSDMQNGSAPADYTTTPSDSTYRVDNNGNYLDQYWNITTDPEEYVEVAPEPSQFVSAANVVFWFTGGTLYRKGTTWADKTAVPTSPGNGTYIAEGDLLVVFSPVTGDTTTYWYNGSSWVQNGPTGILSSSKWFVDLNNAVKGKNGHLAVSANNLHVTGRTYTDDKVTNVENQFRYDSKITLDGQLYESGFGLESSGVSQAGKDGETEETAFNSEFWINAKSLVLKNPDNPSIEARFSVTPTGITLGLENTEATRNVVKGVYSSGTTYIKGDVVNYDGSSYEALKTVTNITPSDDGVNWYLFASSGSRGVAVLAYSYDPSSPGNNYGTTPESLTNTDLKNIWNEVASPEFSEELPGDTLIVTNTSSTSGWTHMYSYSGSVWAGENTFVVNGNQVVEGSLNANAIIANTVMRSPKIEFVGDNSSHMRISSATGFGSENQFIEWFGPKILSGNSVNYAALTESNATTYLKTNGDAYFGGSLSAGTLKNGAANTGTSKYGVNSYPIEVGPFGTNGGSKLVVVSWNLVADSMKTGSCPTSPIDPELDWSLERRLGTGSWVVVVTGRFTGSTNGTPEGSSCQITEVVGRSYTYTDTETSTSNFSYRVKVTSNTRYLSSSNTQTQKLSLICTEE